MELQSWENGANSMGSSPTTASFQFEGFSRVHSSSPMADSKNRSRLGRPPYYPRHASASERLGPWPGSYSIPNSTLLSIRHYEFLFFIFFLCYSFWFALGYWFEDAFMKISLGMKSISFFQVKFCLSCRDCWLFCCRSFRESGVKTLLRTRLEFGIF